MNRGKFGTCTGCFILFILMLTVSACSTKPHIVRQTTISSTTPTEIFVVSHGWHTGVVVPARTIQSQLPQLHDRFGSTPYLEFGWGDRDYYQSEEVTSGLTLRAVFWPTHSVVHARAIPQAPDLFFADEEVEVLCLDNRQYALLVSFIVNSFYRGNDGRIIESKNGALDDSQFYQGEGDYYLTNTCNTWTAKSLKSAGQDISPAFKITAGSIMGYLSKHNTPATGTSCRSNKLYPAPYTDPLTNSAN
jgi:uncharacterized protein (TIGR02117 family)